MSFTRFVEHTIDRFMPASLDGDLNDRKRVRLFLLSHIGGPVLGLQIPFILALLDPRPFPHVYILAGSVLAFWAFPFFLRLWPKLYVSLASISLLNLNFAVLWGAYNYGGASSPFLLWYVLIPLLAFFYLGGGRRAKIIISLQIAGGLGIFCGFFAFGNVGFPNHLPAEMMVWPGLLSVFCATIYAFFMASYYSEVVDSQSDLIKEIDSHQKTLRMLTVAKEEAENGKALIQARNHELEAARSHLEHTAFHDWLTGLPNRRYVESALAEIAVRCRGEGGQLALMHVDLDRFKLINDNLGHVAGDAMLQHVANILRNKTSDNDLVARVGGDEFLIVRALPSGIQVLMDLAESIIQAITRPVPYGDRLCRFGACIGIAVETGSNIKTDQLMINSDAALYHAKMRGGNRAEVFSKELETQALEKSRLGDDVLRGLEANEFIPYYQPQFDATTLELVGVEALVRWLHPKDGVRAPASFLAAASDLNVVSAIDRSVLDQALEDMRTWRKSGVMVRKLSVNVSAARLNDENLMSHLRELKIEPGLLSFELVESIFLDDCDAITNSTIEEIKRLGIDIEIDDFGTGHASIVSLLKLSPKRLKIDRQFIGPILKSNEHSRLVASIIEIGKSMGVEVIAEGVETMEQAKLLRMLGCDTLQGFSFACPMSAADFVHFIEAPPWQVAS
jgi:diguanylate cyclase (GGDEF)-like protein